MQKDAYRRCASIMVFRPADHGYEFLLVHKPRKNDAWQLPQGGCEEGEEVAQAAKRELKEEAGVEVTFLSESTQTYRYDFPPSYRRFRPDNVCGQCIRFVFGLLKEGQEIRVDTKEIDSYAWILPGQESSYIKRGEYVELVRKLAGEGMQLLPL